MEWTEQRWHLSFLGVKANLETSEGMIGKEGSAGHGRRLVCGFSAQSPGCRACAPPRSSVGGALLILEAWAMDASSASSSSSGSITCWAHFGAGCERRRIGLGLFLCGRTGAADHVVISPAPAAVFQNWIPWKEGSRCGGSVLPRLPTILPRASGLCEL